MEQMTGLLKAMQEVMETQIGSLASRMDARMLSGDPVNNDRFWATFYRHVRAATNTHATTVTVGNGVRHPVCTEILLPGQLEQ
jgi:hypothetical protein